MSMIWVLFFQIGCVERYGVGRSRFDFRGVLSGSVSLPHTQLRRALFSLECSMPLCTLAHCTSERTVEHCTLEHCTLEDVASYLIAGIPREPGNGTLFSVFF